MRIRKRFLVLLGVVLIASVAYGAQVVNVAPLTYKILTTVVSVGNTATSLPTTAMPGRTYIQVQNIGTATVYIGDVNVTADTASTGGIQVKPYAVWFGHYDDSVVISGIVASGTNNVVVEEGK